MRVNLKIPWLVFASALMTLLLFGLADAQDGSLDQEAIEQALRDALPKNSEIMIPFDEIERDSEIGGWKSPDPNVFGVTYVRAGYKQFQCPKNEIWEPKDYFHVSIMLESRDRKHPPYPLEEDYRAQNQKFYSEVVPERYEGLPGGTISERLLSLEPDEYQNIYCTIAFWKSPLYDGTIELWAQVNNRDTQGCQPSYATRKAEAKKLIRSECERLAKLVYDRLPDGDVAQPSVQSAALPSASSSESLAPKQAAQDDYPDEDATALELGKILQKKLASIDRDKDISKDALKEVKTRKAEVIAASTTASKRQPTKSQPERYDQAVLRGVWEGIKNGVVFISPWYVKYPLSWGPWLIEKLPKYLKKGDDESVKKTWIDKYGREKPEGTRPME